MAWHLCDHIGWTMCIYPPVIEETYLLELTYDSGNCEWTTASIVAEFHEVHGVNTSQMAHQSTYVE